jgi:hypothetical protein
VVHIGESRSAGFWAVIKAETGQVFFAYGKGFLNHPEQPKVGANVEFTPLPVAPGGPFPRATEIAILPSKRKRENGDTIVVVRLPDGMVRIVARGRSAERVLGELKLDAA